MKLPGFGTYIRAARLMYHWSDRHGCFIRITAGEQIRIDLAPHDLVPSRYYAEDHVVWWESPKEIDRLLDSCEALREIADGPQIEVPQSFYVDEQGRRCS